MTKPRRRSVPLALLVSTLSALLVAAVGPARANTESVQTIPTTLELEGTLGPYRIGMALDKGADGTLVSGHYFYANHLIDIPLNSSCAGTDILLSEPGGGQFRLRLTDQNKPVGGCTAWGKATKLLGEWTQGARRFPVALGMTWQASFLPGQRRYGGLISDADAVFERKVREFITAVLDGDRQAASRFVSFPLRVNRTGGHRSIATPQALSANWTRVFTPDVLSALRDAIPHEMFTRDQGAMVGNGLVWFNGSGAIAVNVPERTTP